MNNKIKIALMIVMGIILAAIGVFASILMIQRFQASQAPSVVEVEPLKTSVVIMVRDLALGDRITENDVTLTNVPIELAPRNIVGSVDEVVGKMIKTDMIQGQMVLSNNLAAPTTNNHDLSFILSDQHVLMAFPAEDLMSQQSMVQRGDIVDIFATFWQDVRVENRIVTEDEEPIEPEQRTFTVDALQNVGVTALVLDVVEQAQSDSNLISGDSGQSSTAPNRRINAYLLALNPQDALILKHLKDSNAIFDIVLRSPTSTEPFELTPVTEEFINEFYGLEIYP